MQFEGGYDYPTYRVCMWLSGGAILVTLLVWWAYGIAVTVAGSLFLGLEGTVLLASAYTPIGLVPPQDGIFRQLMWLIKPQKGTPVSFNQPMFFGGLLCLALSFIDAVVTA